MAEIGVLLWMATPSSAVQEDATVVTVERLPPGEPDWLGLVVMLLMLALAAGFAGRRSLQDAQAPPRLLRIFYTAAMFAGSLTLWLVVERLVVPDMSDDLLPMAAIAAVILTAVGLVVFGIADFWLGLLRPRRTRRWIAYALLAFVLVVTAPVTIALCIQESMMDLIRPEMLQLIVLGAVAGIVWWSYLPALHSDLAERFD